MNIIEAIIETPKGSCEKYVYDEETGFFKLKKVLPSGMVFPYDFGFIPNTKAEDGDPIDVLIISEFKSFPGCMMECRIIGNIQTVQTDKQTKEVIENDRFLAVPVVSVLFNNINNISDFPHELTEQLASFFIIYNKEEGKLFEIRKINNAKKAIEILKKQMKAV